METRNHDQAHRYAIDPALDRFAAREWQPVAAAGRPSLRGGTSKAVAALVTRALAEKRETSDANVPLRSVGDLQYGMFVTPAGLMAIDVAPESEAGEGAGPADAAPAATGPRTSKTAAVVALLQRTEGATLHELIAATGWLPHTTRAGLTGLRKKGHV